MHPVDHARSTAAWLGLPDEAWMEYLPPHHWMDATKAVFARIQHRALRHHAQGVEIAVRRMGPQIGTADLHEVMVRHLSEDTSLGRMPQACDWLASMELPSWLPQAAPLADALAYSSARRWGGPTQAWLPLHSWFLDPMGCEHIEDCRWMLMRHHAWGTFDCEEEFGPVFNGVPTRVVAEAHVRAVLGTVPPASDWLRLIPLRSWMSPSPLATSSILGAANL